MSLKNKVEKTNIKVRKTKCKGNLIENVKKIVTKFNCLQYIMAYIM